MKNILLLLILFLLLPSCESFKRAATPVEVQYGNFDAKGYFYQANELVNAGQLSEAERVLEAIIAQDATKQYEPLARVRLADVYYQKGGYEQAALEYENFLELHPHHEYAALTQYRLAMSYYKQIKNVDTGYELIQKALKEFRKLQTTYPRNPYMEETEQRIQVCLNFLAEFESYVGDFYYKKDSYKAASLRYRGLIYKYPNFKNESEVLLKLGKAYKNIGEQYRAVETFKTIIQRYPNSEHAEEAQELISSIMEKNEY